MYNSDARKEAITATDPWYFTNFQHLRKGTSEQINQKRTDSTFAIIAHYVMYM